MQSELLSTGETLSCSPSTNPSMTDESLSGNVKQHLGKPPVGGHATGAPAASCPIGDGKAQRYHGNREPKRTPLTTSSECEERARGVPVHALRRRTPHPLLARRRNASSPDPPSASAPRAAPASRRTSTRRATMRRRRELVPLTVNVPHGGACPLRAATARNLHPRLDLVSRRRPRSTIWPRRKAYGLRDGLLAALPVGLDRHLRAVRL